MAWDPVDQRGLDATREFGDLLAKEGAIIDSVAEAMRFGKAFIDVANPELHAGHALVGVADGERLGRAIEDPVAKLVGDRWELTASTWSEENGILSEWTVSFEESALVSAVWSVDAVGVGEFTRDWELPALRPGYLVENTYSVSGHSLAAFRETPVGDVPLLLPAEILGAVYVSMSTATNFDGSVWDAAYPGVLTEPAKAVGDAGAAVGAEAYSWQVDHNTGGGFCGAVSNPDGNWGFGSRDPDCVLELRIVPADALFCGACIVPGNDTLLYVSERIHEIITADLQWYAEAEAYNATETIRMVVAHLHLVYVTSPTAEYLPDVHRASLPGDFMRDDGTIDPEHFAMRAVLDPALVRLYDGYEATPGFLGASPVLDGRTRVVAHFAGSLPADLLLGLVPNAWDFNMSSDVRAGPPRLTFANGTADNWTSQAHVADAEPFGPGAKLLMRIPGLYGEPGCTAGFAWRDQASPPNYYLTTAGHCVFPENAPDFGDLADTQEYALDIVNPPKWSSVPRSGYNVSDVTQVGVRVCVRNCSHGSLYDDLTREDVERDCETIYPPRGGQPRDVCTPAVLLRRFSGVYERLGDVLYGVWNGTQEDFSLIRVDPAWIDEGRLDPRVPFWSGPTWEGCPPPLSPPAQDVAVPRLVLTYGNGIVLSEIAKPRAGFFFSDCERAGPAFVPVSFGDSGAPYAFASASPTLPSQALEATYAGRTNSAVVDSELQLAATSVATVRSAISRDLDLELILLCEGGVACAQA